MRTNHQAFEHEIDDVYMNVMECVMIAFFKKKNLKPQNFSGKPEFLEILSEVRQLREEERKRQI